MGWCAVGGVPCLGARPHLAGVSGERCGVVPPPAVPGEVSV